MPSLDRPDFSSRQLRAVLAVAENRSFIAAAAYLKISQPALTRTVKQIESQLGVELFSRTTRQVTTTRIGKEFVALAERLLNDLKIGVDSLRQHGAQQRGQIVVSSVLLLAEPNFLQRIAQFRNRHPGIDIHLREGMQGSVLDDVRSGASDLGIAYVNALPENFVSETLGVEALHVLLPINHPLARQKKIELRALQNETFVSYPVDARTRRLVDHAAAALGFAPHHAITVNRVPTLMSMVRNRIGVAIVPSSERPSSSDRLLTSRPLAHTPISRLGILRLRERELTPALSDFLIIIREWIRIVAPTKLRAAKRSSRVSK